MDGGRCCCGTRSVLFRRERSAERNGSGVGSAGGPTLATVSLKRWPVLVAVGVGQRAGRVPVLPEVSGGWLELWLVSLDVGLECGWWMDRGARTRWTDKGSLPSNGNWTRACGRVVVDASLTDYLRCFAWLFCCPFALHYRVSAGVVHTYFQPDITLPEYKLNSSEYGIPFQSSYKLLNQSITRYLGRSEAARQSTRLLWDGPWSVALRSKEYSPRNLGLD
jgi:hypothetical protein